MSNSPYSNDKVARPTANLFVIESCIEANKNSTWDLVERLRTLRRRLDGSTPPAETDSKVETSLGILDRMAQHTESQGFALQDLAREIELLESLLG